MKYGSRPNGARSNLQRQASLTASSAVELRRSFPLLPLSCCEHLPIRTYHGLRAKLLRHSDGRQMERIWRRDGRETEPTWSPASTGRLPVLRGSALTLTEFPALELWRHFPLLPISCNTSPSEPTGELQGSYPGAQTKGRASRQGAEGKRKGTRPEAKGKPIRSRPVAGLPVFRGLGSRRYPDPFHVFAGNARHGTGYNRTFTGAATPPSPAKRDGGVASPGARIREMPHRQGKIAALFRRKPSSPEFPPPKPVCIRHSFPSGSSLFPFTLQPKRSAVARLPWDYRQARLPSTSSSLSSHFREMRDTGPATIARLLERRRPRRRRNATGRRVPRGRI